ncbi:MAG: trehalose-phosphatase, partial [Acidobacteriota bacterium]
MIVDDVCCSDRGRSSPLQNARVPLQRAAVRPRVSPPADGSDAARSLQRPSALTLPTIDAGLWIERVRRNPLALLLDLDGTLIPFADTTEQALFDRPTERLMGALAAADVRVVIVSGRALALTERVRESAPSAWWIAEHGAWRRTEWKWEGPSVPAPELAPLVDRLSAFAIPGLRIEQKSRGVAVHWRMVPVHRRAAAVAAIGEICREWLERHADYQWLDGV